MMNQVAIIGTGFVADLYARSLKTFPRIKVVGAWDRDPRRLKAFCAHWGIPAAASFEALLAENALVLNLTNPASHAEVNRAALSAGRHVYSEKPLAMSLNDARMLAALAQEKKLELASAPCSMLGEAAQTAWKAVRSGEIGTPRLVYAELDDDFIAQAPTAKWANESGAPWPLADELRTGCTLEHAGYYLSWLMAMFGPVRTVSAASASLGKSGLPDGETAAPNWSTASLFFESGVVARLTCSILAPHDHKLRIIGESGVLELEECWDNSAAVRIRRRHVLRRRLINSPFTKKVRLSDPTHPKVGRKGAASMNFALGPAEMLEAIAAGRKPRLGGDFALHLTEVSLAIQNAGEEGGSRRMTTRFNPVEPMPWANRT